MLDLVAQVRQDHPHMGGKKLYYLLKEQMVSQGIKLGRDALFDLLAANNLLVRRRKRKAITTFSRHKFRKYPNLVKDLTPLQPNQVWVADITYWFTEVGCLYLSLLTDAYSHRIMGFAVAETLATVHCRGSHTGTGKPHAAARFRRTPAAIATPTGHYSASRADQSRAAV